MTITHLRVKPQRQNHGHGIGNL